MFLLHNYVQYNPIIDDVNLTHNLLTNGCPPPGFKHVHHGGIHGQRLVWPGGRPATGAEHL